ncbi:MAG: hypothetical protein AYK19_13590 [Theionarchaea archaeon DG-70-1]|nr:MAG: hypothetical protein AYK19_13590 [Theionarchaea archaeon DG-70-1]
MVYRRAVMAFQCGKMYDEYGEVIIPYVEDFINRSIFYGMHPVMKDDFFANCNYEAVRDMYKKIIPIVDELHSAGWEPLTYAKTDELIGVERFGKGDTVYIAVRNFDETAKDYTLVIQQEKIGIGENPVITEMLSDKDIQYEYKNGIVIFDSLESNETKIFKISSTSVPTVSILSPNQLICLFFPFLVFHLNPFL